MTKEEIDNQNIGFAYESAEELLSCMEKLYKNRELRDELSQNAFRLFHEKYASDVIYSEFAMHCERVVQLYNERI